MTEAEEQELREECNALAQAEQSPWEPRCVARAFMSPAPGALVLTMQRWIDLEAVKSPLLLGRLPDGDDLVAQMSAAVHAFDLGAMEVTPAELLELAEAMLDAVREAFAMNIKMRAPGASGLGAASGFGLALPILACLLSELHLSRLDALATPVCQAFGLIAGHRSNQGWTALDATYAQRDSGLVINQHTEEEAS